MTANEAFAGYFKSISTEERAKITRTLIIQLEITANIVRNWRYSQSKIRPIYRREIIKIIGKDIFENVTD